MSERITRKQCEQIAALVGREMLAAGLLELDQCLIVEAGSATYGRGWKVHVMGGKYGTGWHTPQFGDLWSKDARGLWGRLHAVLRTLEAVRLVNS